MQSRRFRVLKVDKLSLVSKQNKQNELGGRERDRRRRKKRDFSGVGDRRSPVLDNLAHTRSQHLDSCPEELPDFDSEQDHEHPPPQSALAGIGRTCIPRLGLGSYLQRADSEPDGRISPSGTHFPSCCIAASKNFMQFTEWIHFHFYCLSCASLSGYSSLDLRSSHRKKRGGGTLIAWPSVNHIELVDCAYSI